jgi:hypothetical protein
MRVPISWYVIPEVVHYLKYTNKVIEFRKEIGIGDLLSARNNFATIYYL